MGRQALNQRERDFLYVRVVTITSCRKTSEITLDKISGPILQESIMLQNSISLPGEQTAPEIPKMSLPRRGFER